MTTTLEKTKHVAHDTVHPIQSGKRLVAEANEGETARTPVLALTGVALVAGTAVALLMLAAMLVYYFG
jgi:hypothetical protein